MNCSDEIGICSSKSQDLGIDIKPCRNVKTKKPTIKRHWLERISNTASSNFSTENKENSNKFHKIIKISETDPNTCWTASSDNISEDGLDNCSDRSSSFSSSSFTYNSILKLCPSSSASPSSYFKSASLSNSNPSPKSLRPIKNNPSSISSESSHSNISNSVEENMSISSFIIFL
jgi:hypothetical protein